MTQGIKGRSDTIDGRCNQRPLAVGYIRVSTTGQGENGSSLELQRRAIETYSHAMNYKLIEIFEDVASGVGAKSFYGRKNLQAALDLVNSEDAILIVWAWDRLSRHANFHEQVRKVVSDVSRIVCAKDGLDMLEASRAAKLVHSEQTALKISRATKEGMAKKRSQGSKFGNPEIRDRVQPLGTLASSKKAKDHDHRVTNALRKLPNVMDASRAQVADFLNQCGLQTSQKKQWNKYRVTEPLKRARKIFKDEEMAKTASSPIFGIF